MSIKLFDCRYCGRSIYDDEPGTVWDKNQYVHGACLERARQEIKEEPDNSHQHLQAAILELADTLDSVTQVGDPIRFIRGIAHGLRVRAAVQ